MEMPKWSNKEKVKYLTFKNHFIFYETLSHTLIFYIIPVQRGIIPFFVDEKMWRSELK